MADESKVSEKEMEDLDTQVKLWHTRIDALMKGYAGYLKEHPRASAHFERLGEVLKQDIDNFILKDLVPLSTAPSEKEIRESVSHSLPAEDKLAKEREKAKIEPQEIVKPAEALEEPIKEPEQPVQQDSAPITEKTNNSIQRERPTA